MNTLIAENIVKMANSDFFAGTDDDLKSIFKEMKERADRAGHTSNPEYKGYENVPISVQELNEGTRSIKTKFLYPNLEELTRDEDFKDEA